jgi:hypothetical protein
MSLVGTEFLADAAQILADVRSLKLTKAERAEVVEFAAWLEATTVAERIEYWKEHCGKADKPDNWLYLLHSLSWAISRAMGKPQVALAQEEIS